MKMRILFSIILAFFFLSGCSLSFQNKKSEYGNNDQAEGIAPKDLIFDIDIKALSYQLPPHTKLCIPKSSYYCSVDDCEKVKPAVFIAYDENEKKVYRCDNEPCSGYYVTEEISGIYTNLAPIALNGSLVKLSSDNEYVETVSLGLDFIVYRGNCVDNN